MVLFYLKNIELSAIYTNLTDVPENLEIGSIVAGRASIGKINTSEIDFLTSFTGFSELDSTKVIVKENVVNVDIFFEKDEITRYYLGQGIDVESNKIQEFFNYAQ